MGPLKLFNKKHISKIDDFLLKVISGEIDDFNFIVETMSEFENKYKSYNIDDEVGSQFEIVIRELKAKNDKKITHNESSPRKGRNLLSIESNYTVIDVETTGLSFHYDEIIELSGVKVRDGKVHSEFSTLINPGFKVNDSITRLTGITNSDLESQPRIDKVIDSFMRFIGADILVGHNINFDIQFINSALLKCSINPLANDYIDTLRISRRVNKDLPNHKLDTLIQQYNLSRDTHRSLNDCRLTNMVYVNLCDRIKHENISLKPSNHYSPYSKVDLKSLTPETSQFDEDNFFFQKNVCFTGTLEQLQRKEAAQLIVNLGGFVSNTVTKSLDVLVLGNSDYQIKTFGDKSSKHQKAEELVNQGYDIAILDEGTFLDLIK